jgi:hypothetical protein
VSEEKRDVTFGGGFELMICSCTGTFIVACMEVMFWCALNGRLWLEIVLQGEF